MNVLEEQVFNQAGLYSYGCHVLGRRAGVNAFWASLLCIPEPQSKKQNKKQPLKAETKFQFYFLVDCRDTDLSVKVKVPQTWHKRI